MRYPNVANAGKTLSGGIHIFFGGVPRKHNTGPFKTHLGRKLVKIVVVIGIGKIMPRIVIFTAMTMFIQ